MTKRTILSWLLIALAMPVAAQDAPTEVDSGVVDDSGVNDNEDSGVVDGGVDGGAESDGGVEDADTRAEDVGADAGPEDGDAEDNEPAPGEGPELEPEPEPVLTEEHRPSLTFTLDPQDGLMTGDLVTLTIVADAMTGDDISVPDEQELAPFEILEADAHTQENGARTTHTFTLTLIALAPGEFELAPITVRILTEDGIIGEVETDIIRIEVGSVLGNEPNAEPRPATEPVELLEDDPTLYWIGGGLLLILLTALITWLLARYWRRREKAAAPPPPPRPAEEIALEKLNALRQRRDAMLREGEGVEFVDGVSDAVREYLGHRFGFDGLESTTDEVLARLRKRRKKDAPLKAITGLLQDCDLVKFAKADFTEEQSELLLKGSFHIVRSTTHVLPAAAIPPGPNQPQSPTQTRTKTRSSRKNATGEQRWMPPSPEDTPEDEPVSAQSETSAVPTPERPRPTAPQPGRSSIAEHNPFARPPAAADPAATDAAAATPAPPVSAVAAEPRSRFARPLQPAQSVQPVQPVQSVQPSSAVSAAVAAAALSASGPPPSSPVVPTPEPRVIPQTLEAQPTPASEVPAPKPRPIPTTLPSIDPALVPGVVPATAPHAVPAGTFGKVIPQTLPPFAPVMRPPADTLPDGVASSQPTDSPTATRKPSSGSLAGPRGAVTLRETPFSADFEAPTHPDPVAPDPASAEPKPEREPEGER